MHYLDRCRAAIGTGAQTNDAFRSEVAEFAKHGVTSFRSSQTESLAKGIAQRIAENEAAGRDTWITQKSDDNIDAYAGDVWMDFPEVRDLLRGPIGSFLASYYATHVKYYFGSCYRSKRRSNLPAGSQLWHSDSGPGICTNVMVYLTDVGAHDGPLQVLPWHASLPIFLRQPGAMRSRLSDSEQPLDKIAQREILCRYHEEQINAGLSDQVRTMTGPAGTVIPFFNNSLHRGGFPDTGHSRIAIVFHCYPSHRPTNWAHYDTAGLTKRGSYPSDPAEDF
ncbi:MAG: hypothetical protein AAF563_13935 [Pseudomonadota bacterium]